MKEMTDLDKELQQLAGSDWPRFCELVGEKAVQKAKICMLRKKNKSYNVISRKLKISYKVARSGKCCSIS